MEIAQALKLPGTMHGAIGVWLRWCTHPLVGGSDVSCHVICCDIRSEHAVLDAGVVWARGGRQNDRAAADRAAAVLLLL
jgi:hypothetical protein